MRAIHNSIARRMLAVVLATTFAALLLSGAALLFYDARAYQDEWIGDLAAQADILARASAPALAFNDEKAARENLSLLRLRPGILAGAIYTSEGRLFASYLQPGLPANVTIPDAAHREGYLITADQIVLTKDIREGSQLQGRVVLRGKYELLDRLTNYVAILAVVMVASMLLAALLAMRLQQRITQPIESLTSAARRVVETRDFSQRVERATQDEIGVLVDSFNAMLAEVGRRATALEDSNRTLEHEMHERRSAEEALRIADRRKDEFLATLAHELRNPLAPLRNGLEILRLKANDPAQAQAVREMMQRQLNQMVRLVDDLLDVSRITTGRLALKIEATDLVTILRSAIETARPIIDAQRHALTVDMPEEGIPLDADPTRLAQVFSNLLNNAARYTPAGGTVELRVERRDSEAIVIVRDSGIGLSAESMRDIFQMFVQVDKSLERITAGLGVGLSLAQRLVQLHGGNIEARSAGLGLGSEFVVRLPIVRSLSAAPAATRFVDSLVRPRRILVVDDNIDFAVGLAAILTERGHEVRVAHDGAAALAQARTFGPELAFLDIGMPNMSGYELAQRLRRQPETARTVLIAVTGWGQEADRARATLAGFDHHFVKPVDFDAIYAVVEGERPAVAAQGSSIA